jgi:beta-galactosidase GanA
MQALPAHAGVKPVVTASDVEITLRQASQDRSKQWLFVLNHNSEPKSVDVPGGFADAFSGTPHSGKLVLKPYDVAVLRRA